MVKKTLMENICVTTLNTPNHAKVVANHLEVEYVEKPKIGDYDLIYLISCNFLSSPQTFDFLIRHWKAGSKILIHWIGSDILELQQMPSEQRQFVLSMITQPGFLHVAEFLPTNNELKDLGINTVNYFPMPPKYLPDLMSFPEKFTIGIYMYGREQFYHWGLMKEVMKICPKYNFIVYGKHPRYTYEKIELPNVEYRDQVDMMDLLPEVVAHLRFTVHDGLPLGPLEYIMAGRYVVTNVPEVKHTTFLPIQGNAIEVPREAKEVKRCLDYIKGNYFDKNKLNEHASIYWREELRVKKFKQRIFSYITYDPQTYWDKRASEWIKSHEADNYLAAQYPVLDFIKDFDIKSIIELGCGQGRWAKIFNKYDYTGIDISEKLIKYCKEQYSDKKFIIDKVEDFESKKKYDLVFTHTLLENIPVKTYKKTIPKIKELSDRFLFLEAVKGDCFGVAYMFRQNYEENFNIRYFEEINKHLAMMYIEKDLKEKPKLSVVIANYNREKFLKECLEGLKQQTFKDYELIIVDDCSTDNSREIINEHANEDKRIRRIYLNENVGVGRARNIGNKFAQSDIIVVQDSDDISLKDRLKTINEYFKKDIDIFYSAYILKDIETKKKKRIKAVSYNFDELKKHQKIGHPTMAYKKKCWDECLYPEEKADVDYGLLLKFGEKKYKFDWSDKELVIYHRHKDQISTKNFNKQQKLAKDKQKKYDKK